MNNSKYMVVDLATQQPTIKPIGDYLFARQGDNRRPLPIWFQQSGQPLALDGYTVEWAQTNADGTPLVVSGTTISESVVGQMVFFFPANAFAVAGTVVGHFLIKKESDGSLISSIDLSFDVKKDNVLMNIDTTPFMNDWERFKNSIKSQTDALQDRVEGFDTTIKGAQEQANSITTLINNNQVAKKTDLTDYLSKSSDGVTAGTLTANDFVTKAGVKLSDLAKYNDPILINKFGDIKRSGFYKFNASTFLAANLPPFLTSNQQTGTILSIFIDSDNAYFKFMETGWEYYVHNGVWSKRINHAGVPLFSGSVQTGDTINFSDNYYKFDYVTWHITYDNQNKYVTTYVRDGHIMFMTSNMNGNSFNHIFLNFIDNNEDANDVRGLTIRSMQTQLSTGGQPVDIKTSINVEMYGYCNA